MRKAMNIICGILAELCALAVIFLGAYRHGRQDGARQAIGLKETGKVADWALEK